MSGAVETTVERIGRDEEPLVVLDGFSPDADALRSFARTAVFGPARNAYPGIRALLPASYWSASQMALMSAAIERNFSLSGPITVIDASFSIVTTAPGELSVAQRLPHCDAFNEEQIALIHYLAPKDRQGTAFYRHRSTGFETVPERFRQIYFTQLESELRHFGPPPPGYISGDTPMFEQILEVEARFNRALLYRGKQLHSGAIDAPDALSPDPETGRLTVTAFLKVG